MIDDLAHLFTVVFYWPIIVMVAVCAGWAVLEGILTLLLFPWRNRRM